MDMPKKKQRSVILPWLLFLAALGGFGWFYFAVHNGLAMDCAKKDGEVAAAKAALAAAKQEADTANASKVDLQKAQAEVKQAREDLSKSSAQQAEDQRLIDQLKKDLGSGGADVNNAEGKITVTMVDKILFKQGESDLTPAGEEVLRKLGKVLAGSDKLIEVCGHADNTPVKSELKELYPTNWELSTARATNVVRFLQEEVGVKPRQLMAAGFSSYRPVATNASVAGRAKNRRIEILLLPQRMKVVKGDFSDELADAKASKKATPAPRAKDRDRVKAAALVRAKRSPKHR
jgi:chemotaxis protein MotB